MVAVLRPRVAPRRSTARATTWWGKAWIRAVEEAAYAEADLDLTIGDDTGDGGADDRALKIELRLL